MHHAFSCFRAGRFSLTGVLRLRRVLTALLVSLLGPARERSGRPAQLLANRRQVEWFERLPCSTLPGALTPLGAVVSE
jgi:hypothetical protein